MSGAIPPFPQYAFMAWYSVKAQVQLYLYFTHEMITSDLVPTDVSYGCTVFLFQRLGTSQTNPSIPIVIVPLSTRNEVTSVVALLFMFVRGFGFSA
jgi:hypothetical protein